MNGLALFIGLLISFLVNLVAAREAGERIIVGHMESEGSWIVIQTNMPNVADYEFNYTDDI